MRETRKMVKLDLRKIGVGVLFVLLISLLAFPQLSPQENEVIKTIRSYYQVCQEENPKAYLNLMYVQDEERDMVLQEAQGIWAAVETVDYSLSNIQVAFSQDGQTAIARYVVEATIAKETDPQDRFRLEATYLMILRFENGAWKVEAVQREDIFTRNIKTLYSFQMTREFLDELEKSDVVEEEKTRTESEERISPPGAPSPAAPATPLSPPTSKTEELVFADDFNQGSLSSAWVIQSGEWVIDKGRLKAVGQNGVLWLAKEMPDNVAVEVKVRGNYDLNIAIAGNGDNHPGYLFSVGGWWNTKSALVEGDNIIMTDPLVVIENPQRASLLRLERRGSTIKCFLNGRLIFTYDQADLRAEEGFNKISLRNWGSILIFDDLKVYALKSNEPALAAEAGKKRQVEQRRVLRPKTNLPRPESKTTSKREPVTIGTLSSKRATPVWDEDKNIMKIIELEPKHYLQYISTSPDGKKVLALEKDKSISGWYKGGGRVILIDVEWRTTTVLMAGNDTIEVVPDVIYRPMMIKGGLPVFGFARKEGPSRTGYYLSIGSHQRRIDARLFPEYLNPLRNFDIHVAMVSSPLPHEDGFLAIFKVDLPTELAFKYGDSEYISFCFVGAITQAGTGIRVWGGPSIRTQGGRPVLSMKGVMIEAPLRLVPVSLPSQGVVILFTGRNLRGERGIYSLYGSKPNKLLSDWMDSDFYPVKGPEFIMRVASGEELGVGGSRPLIQLYNVSRGEARILKTDLSGTARGLGGIPVFALSPNRRELIAVKSDLNSLIVVDLEKDIKSEISLGELTVDLAGFGHSQSVYSTPVAREYIYFSALNGDRSDLYILRRPKESSLDLGSAEKQTSVRRSSSEERATRPAPRSSDLSENVPDISGVWDTNFGRLTITQEGFIIRGEYSHDQGRIEGVLVGRTIKGKWSEAPSYRPPQDAGEFEFTFAQDFKSFTGKWRYGFETKTWNGDWFGSKLK